MRLSLFEDVEIKGEPEIVQDAALPLSVRMRGRGGMPLVRLAIRLGWWRLVLCAKAGCRLSAAE
jgi:hypothetical protein